MAQNDAMRALRVNQNSKVAARQLNNELKLAIKLHVSPKVLEYCQLLPKPLMQNISDLHSTGIKPNFPMLLICKNEILKLMFGCFQLPQMADRTI